MRRHFSLLISASVGLAIFSALTLAQAPAGQGGPPGPGRGPAPVPLSQVKWETWNNTGLRAIPVDTNPDGPAPRRDLTGIWDPARGGIGPRGARNPAPLTEWGQRLGNTHNSGDGIRQVSTEQINDPLSEALAAVATEVNKLRERVHKLDGETATNADSAPSLEQIIHEIDYQI